MDKNIIWVVLIIIGVVAVSIAVSTTAPAGASFHPHTYTDEISGANGNRIIINDEIETDGGLVIQSCGGDGTACPTIGNAQPGQIWIDTSASVDPVHQVCNV